MLRKRNKFTFLFGIALVLCSSLLFSQRKIEHVQSNLLQKDPTLYNGNIFFSGNVIFRHEGTFLYADTVIFYEKENRIEAFSNARMNVGDTVSLKSYRMEYDGNIRKAFARENVVLKDRSQTLETQELIYDRNTNKAYFNTRSKIIQKGNIMYSNFGVYDLTRKTTTFDKDVKISTEDYDIDSHNLNYSNATGVAVFKGPTVISEKENPKNRIYTEDGVFNTKTEEAFLYQNNKIYSNGKIISGDEMYSNQKTGYSYAKGHFFLNDPSEKRFLKGGYGEYYEPQDSAIVTEKPYVVKAFKRDSLYVSADTIIAKRDSAKLSTVDAFRKVRVFKSDMQAKADSLNLKESIGQMHFYYDPVFWNGHRQITGDTIIAFSNVKEERLDSIQVRKNAFAISKTDSLTTTDFNQVKGRFMLGLIRNEELRYVKVEGNAQSIVYVDDEDPKTKEINRIGINKSDCGIIEADFYERTVNIIECNINGEGKLYPVSKLLENERKLKDFVWREKERPKKWTDIFLDIPEQNTVGEIESELNEGLIPERSSEKNEDEKAINVNFLQIEEILNDGENSENSEEKVE